MRALIYLSMAAMLAFGFISCEDKSSSAIPSDGWQVSTPLQQGLDSALLAQLTAAINQGDYGAIHSLVIVRHGYLVYERYFGEWNSETLHPLYSVTKSVTSALIGIAIDQRKLRGTGENLLSLFPDYPHPANVDANKQAITVEDVLTMRAGFTWDESSETPSQMVNSSDWIRFMLDLPMTDAPGSQFCYSGGCSILLAGIIRNTTMMQAHEFAAGCLFAPLGITRKRWDTGPKGITNTAGGLFMRPRDLAKIGLLYLREGNWQGKQVVSSSWIAESTDPLVTFSNDAGYGYQWWTMPLNPSTGSPDNDYGIKYASGYGDQFIFVIPALDLVVVSTAGNYDKVSDQAFSFLRGYILPAVRE